MLGGEGDHYNRRQEEILNLRSRPTLSRSGTMEYHLTCKLFASTYRQSSQT